MYDWYQYCKAIYIILESTISALNFTCSGLKMLFNSVIMIRLGFVTPLNKLNKIKLGDEIIDEYESRGRVVKITKNLKNREIVEFIFLLDNKKTIFILGEAV